MLGDHGFRITAYIANRSSKQMTLKDLYHTIRPMAALRVGHNPSLSAVVIFPIGAVTSVFGGIASGFAMWLQLGYTPETSGGSLIFIFGSCVMSFLSLAVSLFWRNRSFFYGLNFLTFLTILSVVSLSLKSW